MPSIKQTYLIHSSINEVWQALVNPKYIEKWSGEKALMDDKEGSSFKLWGGSIFGKNIEVQKNKKLVQEWYSDDGGGNWEKPSIATFILSEEKDGVKLDFDQIDVPQQYAKSIEDGWKSYYLGPLKEYLESK